jgi:hypothetical protein
MIYNKLIIYFTEISFAKCAESITYYIISRFSSETKKTCCSNFVSNLKITVIYSKRYYFQSNHCSNSQVKHSISFFIFTKLYSFQLIHLFVKRGNLYNINFTFFIQYLKLVLLRHYTIFM